MRVGRASPSPTRMRVLVPQETQGLEAASALAWRARGRDPGFVFPIAPGTRGFVGFFLWRAEGTLAPKITFDQGGGFSEASALTLKPFPFAFYHVALDTLRDARRLRFRPSEGPAAFRFLPLRLGNPVAVAVLHYLFNLRYQKIGMVVGAAAGGARPGPRAWARTNAARIAKFFRDVSAGQGVRVQEGGGDRLPALSFFLAQEADGVRGRMDAALAGRAAPLLSFVTPVYNTAPAYLDDLLRSFAAQGAAYAELILSDDGSTRADTRARLARAEGEGNVRVVWNAPNAGIAAASNAGIGAARGAWVAFIDHDDQFAAGVAAVIAQAIADHPEAIFFYTDEIVTDAGMRPTGSFCKPAFDSVLLSGLNYINHFSVFRRDRLEALGRLRRDREGSQDYDLLLRYLAGAARGSVVHIPFLGYLWRRGEGTYSAAFQARAVAHARAALRDGHGADVAVEPARDPSLHRLRFARPQPSLSVIIPNRDSPALIRRVVADLRERTAYPGLEIVIVDNGTRDPEVLAFYATLPAAGVTVDIRAEPFNFAAMINRGARLARGETLLFLNNDVTVTEPGWLAEMAECLAFADTGIVGARLLYPDGTIQHHGVIAGLGDAAGHWYVGEAPDIPGPFGRFHVRQTLSAVTAACMLVTRPCFEALGGFDAEAFPIAYNDIDFCLRARAAGYRTVWTPFATLVHHESASRGSDETGPAAERFRGEGARLRARHGTAGLVDDAYSPFYDRRYSVPHLILPPTLPPARPNLFT